MREHLQILYVINDMLKQAEADGLDIHVILPRILQVAALELKAQAGSILIVNANQDVEHAWVIDADDEYTANYAPWLREVVESGLAGEAIRSRKPILVPDTLSDPRWLKSPNDPKSKNSWSVLCVPLMVRKRAIGAITLTKPGIAEYIESDLDLLDAIGAQAAGTIENARLYENAQYQLQVTQLLNKASQVVNSTLDLNDAMQALLTQMNELFRAEAVSIALATLDRTELVYEVADGEGSEGIVGLRVPANQGISGWVLSNGKPLRVNDVASDARFSQAGDKRTGVKTWAMLCAPIRVHNDVIGTLQVLNPSQGIFSEDDLDVLVNLANLAGTAFANARQFMRTQAAEARYADLFEESIDPIVLTDVNGRILSANRRAVQLLQHDSAELIGSSIDRLHKTSIVERFQMEQNDGSMSDSIAIDRQFAVTADGSTVPVDIHAKRTLTHDRQIIQWIYHDISEQIELENMRRDLTAMLYHDLQNPLTNIIASLELLEMDLVDTLDNTAKSMLDVATRSSQRLRHLIRSLLDLNQLEAGFSVRERKAVDIAEIISYVDNMMRSQFNRREIDLEIEIAANLPPVNVNADMLQRVFINLLDNAYKYSQAGDTVRILARHAENESYLTIAIADQGPGVPQKERERVFDKFYRAPNANSKGIGLGLAFCRLAVQAHGGEIWITDTEGGGGQFNFTLPTT